MKDDECFGDGTDEDLDTEFDSEGNLALFDKAGVFPQIDGTNNNGAQHHSTPGSPEKMSTKGPLWSLCMHIQGAQGISCSRHLANHEVEVTLFLPNFLKMQGSVTRDFFCRSSGRQVASIKDLPTSLMDLVINSAS